MGLDSFEIPGSSRKKTFAKGEQFFENFSASQLTNMPWNEDLNLLLTPQDEDSLILPSKSELPMQRHTEIPSSFEVLLTPMSSTISPQELLGGINIDANEKLMFGGSPLFENAEIEDSNSWESLFNDVAPDHPPAKESTLLTTDPSFTPVIKDEPSSPAPLTSDSSESKSLKRKRQTSVDSSASSNDYKKDALGITAYNRKPRSIPLSPIVVDESAGDSVLVKRARNTAAARRSRARKLERMTQLEAKVEELISQNNSLLSENKKLKSDMAELRKAAGL